MKTNRVRHTTSKWTIIMNTDIIQWKNNLLEASRKQGLAIKITGITVIRLAEQTAVKEIENRLDTVWFIQIDDGDAVHFTTNAREEGLLCFMRKDEATRFADQLSADMSAARVTPTEIKTQKVRAMSDETGMLIGIVPTETLVSPAMLGGM